MLRYSPFLRLDTIGLACLIGMGCSDKEIARLVGVSRSAVKARVGRILREANMHNRAELPVACADFLSKLGLGTENATQECKIVAFCPYGTYCQDQITGS